MENSNGMHSGKGKVSKGNVGKWRNSSISGTVSTRDSRCQETEDAKKEKEDSKKGRSTGISQKGGLLLYAQRTTTIAMKKWNTVTRKKRTQLWTKVEAPKRNPC